MQDKFIKVREVSEITAKHRSSIYADMAKGIFPKQYKIGQKAAAWKLSEINSWMQSRDQS